MEGRGGSREEDVHSRLLIAALLLWVVFLGYETTIRAWDLYRIFPPVDLPGHFLSGMATAALAYWALLRRGLPHAKRGAVAIAILVALLWEAVEAVQERLWPDDAPWLVDVFFWDGATDVLAGVAGALAAFPFLRWLRSRVALFRPMDL